MCSRMLEDLDGINNLFKSFNEYIDAAWVLACNQESLLMELYGVSIFDHDFPASVGDVACDVVCARHLSFF